MSDFLWGAYPYICAALFFLVPIIRMVYRPFGWSTRASGLFGRKVLGFAAMALHWGLFLLLAGHLAGLFGGLMGWGGWIGFFYWIGLVGGILTLGGSGVALVRRIANPEVRAMSQHDDYLVHGFIIAIVGIALYQVLIDQIFGVAYPAAAWFASLWQLSPQPELMASASLLSKIHVGLALTFFAYFPFTKLVHAWTYPINYAVRSYQSMRTQARQFRKEWETGFKRDHSWMAFGMVALVATFIGAGFLLGGADSREGSVEETESTQSSASDRLTGYPLYVSQCARCHGVSGRADHRSAEARKFPAPARDLSEGNYYFVSTENGVATDGDLRRTIERGLPHSGMPSFGHLDDEQIDSLVAVLDGLWKNRPEPGPVLDPPRPETTEETIQQGKTTFSQQCATCHGETGAGDGPGADGLDVSPANLADGRLKGGTGSKELYRRIHHGFPASGMPAYGDQMESDEIWAIVDYLEAEILPDDSI